MTAGLIVFLLAIATATFLESIYDIQTAKVLIYNALWFEILLTYLGVNLIANIFRFNMFSREKIAMLSFHLAFLVILIGAAITRFVSFEGLMLIPEGKTVTSIYSSDPYIQINNGNYRYTSPKLFMTKWGAYLNQFDLNVEFPNEKEPLHVSFVNYQNRMIDSVVQKPSFKSSMLELVTNGMQSNFLAPGEVLEGGLGISFNKPESKTGFRIMQESNGLYFISDVPVRYLPMAEMQKARQLGTAADSLFNEVPANTKAVFLTTTLYQVNGQQVVCKQLLKHAKRMLVPSGSRKVGEDYLTVKVSRKGEQKELRLKGGLGNIPEQVFFSLNGKNYQIEYGSVQINLPFGVHCKDFQLEKYPGSEAPSSFASEVRIEDPKNGYKRDQRIFMNHVMDYQGYRFFQSSYDLDDPNTPQNEEGTRLSVNYDSWGTNVTYLGYLLMSIGMILSVFAPAGRFRDLNEKLKQVAARKAGNAAIIVFTLLSCTNLMAQHDHNHAHAKKAPVHRIMSKEHSNEIATLLVQEDGGRIIPYHTLADQLLRKIYYANSYETYNAVQVITSMHMYPEYWMGQRIIQVPQAVRERLGLGKYASFKELIDPKQGGFKWMADYNKAHQMLESKRGEFEKKLIKLTDRFQVVQNIISWYYMRLLPMKHDPSNTWYVPFNAALMQHDSLSSRLALGYISSLDKASSMGSYGEATDLLAKLKKYQRVQGVKVVPSERHIKMEVSYNKMNIFKNTYRTYMLLGFIMMFVFFMSILSKPGVGVAKHFKRINLVFIILLSVMFLYHAAGLGMRWYISGHAPWSNGYEAVIFIAWVTVLAGYLFSKKNPVILPGAVILASMMIWVTDMELMDPQITQLQPVLKSYWLKIHVAVITGSYGFLGLSAILGCINLLLYCMRSSSNGKRVTMNINELTYVSEMTMTIGLFMLTIGTFLGGVWANESWGRYWGWDPKETWALVSVLVYAVILHLRFIPALSSKFVFNVVSLWGYAAILFTFFGVNFYLVGLHSYAQGESLGELPNWLWITIAAFILFTLVANFRKKSYAKNLMHELK